MQLIESETREDILKLAKQNTADIRQILHRARSIRSDQGIDDDQSSFYLAQQPIAYGLVASYEAQLSQSSRYQQAQTAVKEDLLARNADLLDEKYALEEKIEGLLLDMDLKDGKVTQLEFDILLREEKIGRLEQVILLKDGRLLFKEKIMTELMDRVASRNKVNDQKDDSIVHRAARNGYVKAVDQLLKEGANIEAAASKEHDTA